MKLIDKFMMSDFADVVIGVLALLTVLSSSGILLWVLTKLFVGYIL